MGINRDIMGRGALKLQEQWRIFRGRARDNDEVYFCLGAGFGWSYKVYKSARDIDTGTPAVAHITQATGTGELTGDAMPKWIPARFEIWVGPGEDAALLLCFATV